MDDTSLWTPDGEDRTDFRPDTIESVARKARTICQWMSEARHVVFFTGPEISVSAGVFDAKSVPRYQGPKGISEAKAQPTRAHMAIKSLLEDGMVQYLITTTTDNLHRKAETLSSRMCELHGNVFQELCVKCGKIYIRDFKVEFHPSSSLSSMCR